MPAQPPTNLLSASQVCELVGFDRSTLSRWVKDGTAVPAMQLPGRTGAYLFTPEEAERLRAEFDSRRPKAATA